jgi:hypothetical protein
MAKKFNGLNCIVVDYAPERGRYIVETKKGKCFKMKSSNLFHATEVNKKLFFLYFFLEQITVVF